MHFTDWQPFAFEPRTADLQRMGVGRAGGVHVSDCIHFAKVARNENVGNIPGEQPWLRAQEGFLWETALEYMAAGVPRNEAMDMAFKRYALSLREGLVKQIVCERDGIVGTPDALNEALGQLESYKLTRRTLRKAREDFAENFWTWVMQEQAYCHMVGVDSVRWIVLWQAGDYSRGIGSGPQCLEKTGTFTVPELESNWKDMLAIAERLR
jgi:hypothetical protein